MKYLGETERIIEMELVRNREIRELLLFQSSYLQKLVGKFRMLDAKIVSTLLDNQTKILIMQCNYNKDEKRRWRILSM